MNNKLVLASSSPRRQYLMKVAGFDFTVQKPEVDETFPDDLPPEQVARYLAVRKAEYFRPQWQDHVIITADTVVILDHEILNKPANRAEAIGMLSRLSGNTHKVMTGVSIVSAGKETSFDETSYVAFRALPPDAIERYIDTFHPYDKAGAYGAQETLPAGMNPCSAEEIAFLEQMGQPSLVSAQPLPDNRVVLIQSITGSYFNVMGLPIHRVYRHLRHHTIT